jgi:hypothetical protein
LSRTLGIRLDKETEERLASLADALKLKKSQLLRRAFNEWARTRENIVGQNMMLCDSLLLAALFANLDDDEVRRVAEAMSDHIVSKIRIRQIEKNRVHESIPAFLSNLTRLVSPQYLGWFSNIKFTYDSDKKITIYGFHSLNTQYSTYAVQLLSLIIAKMHDYDHPAAACSVTENSFILELNPK